MQAYPPIAGASKKIRFQNLPLIPRNVLKLTILASIQEGNPVPGPLARTDTASYGKAPKFLQVILPSLRN